MVGLKEAYDYFVFNGLSIPNRADLLRAIQDHVGMPMRVAMGVKSSIRLKRSRWISPSAPAF